MSWVENGRKQKAVVAKVRNTLFVNSCPDRSYAFNFNSVQLALVLEDYEPPALRVQGFVSRKKGARSIVEEKKEGEKK